VPVGYGAANAYGVGTGTGTDVEIEAVRATLTGPSVGARLGAELFGTFVVLFAALGSALFASITGAGVIGIALGFGFGAIAAFLAVSHVSGGHFNPAITLGAAVAGRTPWLHVPLYWIAQVVGGAIAAAILFVTTTSLEALADNERTFFSGTANGFEDHSPIAQSTGGGGFELIAALLIEGVLAAILVGVYLGATDRRGPRKQAAFAIGLTVAFGALLAYPVTGGALNPARATAAAIFSESWAWGQLWVFWVAPLVGAALAALLYRAFATNPTEDDVLDEDLEIDEVEVEVQPAR
jgi:aquaporin Z